MRYISAQKAREAALKLCRGSYQRGLVLGTQAWAVSDLRGRARDYGDRYKRSRDSLWSRMEDADLAVELVKARTQRQYLIWGTAAISNHARLIRRHEVALELKASGGQYRRLSLSSIERMLENKQAYLHQEAP